MGPWLAGAGEAGAMNHLLWPGFEFDWPTMQTPQEAVGGAAAQPIANNGEFVSPGIEGLTKEYGVEIIVSETTRDAVPDYVYRELDVVRVKGKDEPIAIYEPLAPSEEVSDEEIRELDLHEQALKNLRSQNWDMAEQQFKALAEMSPARKLYPLYLGRVEIFRNEPPGEDWDGVYTHTTK